ncbi:MAG: 50S ribosomal protein L11 [Halobacteriota archaeon]|jgi:large subunit ribosomal protein L11
MVDVIEILVPGGKASPGPPIGPALGPLGINIKSVVDEINEKTASYNGMQVPVKVTVDDKKNVTLEIGIPPASALILIEAGIEKGSSGEDTVGNISVAQAIKIAKLKQSHSLSYELKNTVKEILGTCVSMGVTVDEKPAKEIQQAIDAGEYVDLFAEDSKTAKD